MIRNHRLLEATFQPSPNKGGKLKKPGAIITHFTAGRSASNSARWLCSPAAKASAHLIIGRDGSLVQLVEFDTVAWHAGASEWNGRAACNNWTLGLELDNMGPLSKVNGRWRSLSLGVDVPDGDVMVDEKGRGWQLFSSTQHAMLETISRELIEAYPTITDIAAHSDICIPRGRKLDTGPALDVDVLRSRLFGRA